jgi:hypothetical protein
MLAKPEPGMKLSRQDYAFSMQWEHASTPISILLARQWRIALYSILDSTLSASTPYTEG